MNSHEREVIHFIEKIAIYGNREGGGLSSYCSLLYLYFAIGRYLPWLAISSHFHINADAVWLSPMTAHLNRKAGSI